MLAVGLITTLSMMRFRGACSGFGNFLGNPLNWANFPRRPCLLDVVSLMPKAGLTLWGFAACSKDLDGPQAGFRRDCAAFSKDFLHGGLAAWRPLRVWISKRFKG